MMGGTCFEWETAGGVALKRAVSAFLYALVDGSAEESIAGK